MSTTATQRSRSYFDSVDSADFQYANYDLFHVEHDKSILEATLLDNRGNAVAAAGGIHSYLNDHPASSLNHNNSFGGFFFEHMFPYYSNATSPGPLNHRFIDRIGLDGQTYQDYAGHSWNNFQSKIVDDHQAHQFTVTDDFYRWLQSTHKDFLSDHPNVHPASHELSMGVDNKSLGRDISEARDAELHPLWFVDEVVATEGLAIVSVLVSGYARNHSFDGLGSNLARVGAQQAFVFGSEGMIDFLPGVGPGDSTGHGLLEGHNLELYGGLSVLYAAGEVLLANSDVTRGRTYSMIARRSQIIGTKVVVSKAVAIIGAKVAGLSAKGATLGTSMGPIGTAVGFAIGLGVGLGGGWYFHAKDVEAADKYYLILTDAIGQHLRAA